MIPLLFFPFGLFRRWRRRRKAAALVEHIVASANGNGFPSYRHAIPRLRAELDRARRYEHPLTFLVLTLERVTYPRASGSDTARREGLDLISGDDAPGVLSLLLAPLLGEGLRESDVIAYSAPDDRYVIVLTESNVDEAEQTIRRLSQLVSERAPARLRAGVAEFPRDGLTLDDLLRRAETAWRTEPLEATPTVPAA